MNMNVRRILDPGAIALAALLVLSSCGGGAKKQPTVMSAVMPEADVAMYIKGQEINNSPFGKELEKLGEEMVKGLGKDKNAPDFDQLLEELGLKNEDFLSAMLSLRVGSLKDVKGDGVPEFDICIAGKLAKPVSLSKVQSALTKVFPEIKDKIKMDGKFLNYTAPDTEFSLYQAAAGNNKLHFLGSDKEVVNAAMARLDAKLPAGLEAAKAGLPPGSNFWVVFKVGQTIQDKLKEALENAKAGAQKNPMAQQQVDFLQALQSLKNGSLGLKFAEDLTMAIALNFGSPDDAQQANDILNRMLNMGKGMLAMIGINAPFINTLKAEAKDATITISVLFTTADIKALKKVQQQKKAAPAAASPFGP